MNLAALHLARWRHRRIRAIGVAVAVLAISLRLTLASLPPDPVMSSAESDLVALFGEHALCLAAASDPARRTVPAKPAETPPQHHGGMICCQVHIALGLPLPPTPAVAALAVADAGVTRVPPAYRLIPRRANRTARARAPPDRS